MKVVQKYLQNSLRNFNYIIYSEVTKEAIFIDPLDLKQTLPIAKKLGLNPKYLLNTHYHPDHIQDNSNFLKIEGTTELVLGDGESFEFSYHEKILCRHTPGHVMDHKCYFLFKENEIDSVITGDTIFNAGVGNTKNGGDVSTLYNTIKEIFIPLNSEVKIYPSHDYFLTNLKFAKSVLDEEQIIDEYINKYNKTVTDDHYMNTTIGEEKLYNPFFKAFEGSESQKEFTRLRSLRDKW